MNVSYAHSKTIHLEVSSHCNLKCPGCARTKLLERDELQHFMLSVGDVKQILSLNPEINKIIFSGSMSDIIYYKHLFELLDWFNTSSKRPSLVFSTNGSGKKVDWWESFAKKVSSLDVVYFAIDGMKETNHIYRIGSDWDSIITGIETLKKFNEKVKIVWAYCVFEHNYSQIKSAHELAEKLGIEFLLKLGDSRTPKHMILKSKYWNDLIQSVAYDKS